MKFESKILRRVYFNMLIGAIPDLIFSYLVAWYINEGMIWMLIIYLGLQVLYFMVWAVRSLFTWLYFFLIGRKKTSNFLCDFLHQGNFPVPDDLDKSAKNYLQTVASNNDYDVNVRIAAAHELGALNAWGNLGMNQHLLMMTLSFEDALEEYRRSIIRRKNV